MTPSRLPASILIVALALGGVLAAQSQPTFRSGTQIVPLYVTVTDAQKRLVPDLERGDFEILDNDQVQELAVFRNEVEPVTAVVMLDTSGSMTGEISLLIAAAEQFLIRLLPEDRATVGAFNDKIEFASDFTSDRDALVAALKDLDYGNPTRLYDAVDATLNQLEGIEGRKVALLFTDGEDTDSRIGFGEVLDRARADEVMVYGIGLQTEYFNGVQKVRSRPDKALRRLAEETGGGYFELKKSDELGPTFTRVAQEIHSQYLLGFTPSVIDGKLHKLTVRVKKPGMTPRARKTYVATGDKRSTAER